MKAKNGLNEEKKEEIASNSEIDVLKAKLDEYTNNLKRLQADFENYIKRVEKEKQELNKYAGHEIMSKIVNIVDDFERTLEAVKNIENKEVKEGIEMVHKQMQKMLAESGVKKIDAAGKKFDPYKHEVLDIVEGDEDNIVVDELQKGYLMHDKVLRTCKVRVSRNKEMEETENVQS